MYGCQTDFEPSQGRQRVNIFLTKLSVTTNCALRLLIVGVALMWGLKLPVRIGV